MEIVRGTIKLVDIIAKHWKQYLAWKHNNQDPEAVREQVVKHVNRMLACRSPQLGAHVYRCKTCDIYRIVPHSCHSQFCNSCAVARAKDWGNRVLSDLLDVPYRHVVLSIPRPLRLLIKDNRERLIPILMRAAADSILALTRGDPEPLGDAARRRMAKARKRYTPGIQIALHTFGAQINWHVHLHLIVTAGGLSVDEQEWIWAPERSLVSTVELPIEFKKRVCEAIANAHEDEPLFCRRLRSDGRRRVDPILLTNWLGRQKWHTFIGPSLEDPAATLKYCGRYTRRPAIGETRILNYNGRSVTFRYKDYANCNASAVKTLPVLVFLDRLFQHIPAEHARHFLSYGLFANRVKSRLLPIARQLIAQAEPMPVAPTTWEERRVQSGEKGPLDCPKCGRRMEPYDEIFGDPRRIADVLGIAPDERIPYPTYIDAEQYQKIG